MDLTTVLRGSRLLLAASLIVSMSLACTAQALKIKAHEEKLTHGKPGEELKQAVVRYPELVGLPDREVELKANRSLSLKAVIHQSLEEVKSEFASSSWLSAIDYKVLYLGRYVLSLAYIVDGMGAYPSTTKYYVNVDIRTGQTITPSSAFRAEAIGPLVKKLDGMRAEAVRKAVAREPSYNDILKDTPKFTKASLRRFSVDAQGVTFRFDFDLPHVVQAAAPRGEFTLNYAALRSAIRPDGPLGGFLHR